MSPRELKRPALPRLGRPNALSVHSGAFVHARLADNVEISNPMYLAGDDEAEPPPPAPLAQRHSVSSAFLALSPTFES